MKKVFSLLAALALVFSFVACGGGNVDDALVKATVSKISYDANASSPAWSNVTISLTNATFDTIAVNETISAIATGSSGKIVDLTLTPATAITKGETSHEFKVSTTTNDTPYTGKVVLEVDPDGILANEGKILLDTVQITGDAEIKLKETSIVVKDSAKQTESTSTWTAGKEINLTLTGVELAAEIQASDITDATSSVSGEVVTVESVTATKGSESITLKLKTATATTSDQTITFTIPKKKLTITSAYGVPSDGLVVTVTYTVTADD